MRTTPEPRFNEQTLREMGPSIAAAATRAAWQVWEWDNPWCDDCDERHRSGQHRPAPPADAVPVDLRADGVLWMVNRIDTDTGALSLMGDGTEPWTYEHSIEPEPFAAFAALLSRASDATADP